MKLFATDSNVQATAYSTPNHSSSVMAHAKTAESEPVPIAKLLNRWQSVKDSLENNNWAGYQQLSDKQKNELAPLLNEYWLACEDLLPAPKVIVQNFYNYGITSLSRKEPWFDLATISSSSRSCDDIYAIQSGLAKLNQVMTKIRQLFKRFDAQSTQQGNYFYLLVTMRLAGLFFSILSQALTLLQLLFMMYERVNVRDDVALETGKEQWEDLAEQLKTFWLHEMMCNPATRGTAYPPAKIVITPRTMSHQNTSTFNASPSNARTMTHDEFLSTEIIEDKRAAMFA